jgi:hypothetical protein
MVLPFDQWLSRRTEWMGGLPRSMFLLAPSRGPLTWLVDFGQRRRNTAAAHH